MLPSGHPPSVRRPYAAATGVGDRRTRARGLPSGSAPEIWWKYGRNGLFKQGRYPSAVPSSRGFDPSDDPDEPRLTLWERLKYTLVRPDDDPSEQPPTDDRTVEDLRYEIHRSDDKERVIGLVAAPIAAMVGILIGTASIDYARTHHQNVHVYDELTYVLLGLAVLILVASLLRKRLFQGITLALFGLAVFQLHYTYVGFAAPFILAGAWYLVRTYRLQQALRRAEAREGPPAGKGRTQSRNAARPRSNKRYTPPS